MPEFTHDDWDTKKRKCRESGSESSSTGAEYASSSASGLKPWKRKVLPDWTSPGSEEVGESDDLQLLGREVFEQTPRSRLEKGKVQYAAYKREKDGVVDSHACVIANENDANKESDRKVEGKDEQWAGKKASKPASISLASTRNCMHSLIGELREARKQMLHWMRREMNNILYEGSDSPCMRTSFEGQNGRKMALEEQSSQRINMSSVLGSAGMQFRGESNDCGGEDLGEQNSGREGRAGMCGGQRYCGGTLESDFGMQISDKGEDMALIKKIGEGIGLVLADQKITQVFGTRKSVAVGLGEQSKEPGSLGVHLQNSRVGFVDSFGREDGRNEGVSFSIHNELEGDVDFGGHSHNDAGLTYAGHNTGGATMLFGGQTIEIGGNDVGREFGELTNSMGLGNSNACRNAVRNQQGSSLKMSNEERTPDLMGILNQSGAVKIEQNTVGPNLAWNIMQQSGRHGNIGFSDSRTSSFNYEAHCKPVNGCMGTYPGMVGSSSGFENTAGMISPAVLQNANVAPSLQLPLSLQQAPLSLNSLSMPLLLGMQSQVAMQNSNTQNFLGLSVNGVAAGAAMNRQVFAGEYLQENSSHCFESGKGASMSASPSLHAMSHKRGNNMHGMDIWELNA